MLFDENKSPRDLYLQTVYTFDETLDPKTFPKFTNNNALQFPFQDNFIS